MTENMSRSLLDGIVLVTGTVAAPLVQSRAGKSFFSMLPGEVLLASLDAVSKCYITMFQVQIVLVCSLAPAWSVQPGLLVVVHVTILIHNYPIKRYRKKRSWIKAYAFFYTGLAVQ